MPQNINVFHTDGVLHTNDLVAYSSQGNGSCPYLGGNNLFLASEAKEGVNYGCGATIIQTMGPSWARFSLCDLGRSKKN